MRYLVLEYEISLTPQLGKLNFVCALLDACYNGIIAHQTVLVFGNVTTSEGGIPQN